MQISENRDNQEKMITRSRGMIIILTVLLLLTNLLMTFLLEPVSGSSMTMWQGYARHRSPEVIYLGTSQGLYAAKPSIIEKSIGINSYNMCTNMQTLANSKAALEIVLAEQDEKPSGNRLKAVVLFLDHDVMNTSRGDNYRADASFWRGRGSVTGISERLKNAVYFITDKAFFGRPASIIYFMPWIYNRSSDIMKNVREKIGKGDADTQLRDADGYEKSDEIVDQSIHFITRSEAADWDLQHPELVCPELQQENREVLIQICSICKEKEILLLPVIAPFPNYLNVYNADSYDKLDGELRQLFAEYGFDFRDYNIILLEEKTELLETTDFKDVGHLNTSGADKFSAFLAEDIGDSLKQADHR